MRMHVHRPNADATLKRLQDATKAAIEPPKFCKDCRWHTFKERIGKYETLYKHLCTYPPLLDQITGEPSSAVKNRNTATLCGPQAQYFTPKAKP